MPRDQKLKMKEIGELVANFLYFCLDPIGRSPFLPLRNLHKVELFSVFISHLDDISSLKCSWKCKSLQLERKENWYEEGKFWSHDLENLVYHANH